MSQIIHPPFGFMEAYNHRKFPNTIPATTTPGARSAGFAFERPNGYSFTFNAASGVANRMYEICSNDFVCTSDTSSAFITPFRYRIRMNKANCNLPAGECFQGIQWGSFLTLAPFQTNYAAAPATECVFQLRWDFVNNRWEVCFWDGDVGVAPVRETCTTQTPFDTDLIGAVCELVYFPSDNGATMFCYVNGILLHTFTNARFITNLLISNSDAKREGIFVCTGSNAANVMSEISYQQGQIYNPIVRV